MDIILTEWLSLCLRWLHMIAGMAWIGTSFYFIHLDLTLRSGAAMPRGVQGEAWEVHGGGFYQIAKYAVAPPRLPEELAWFKWEAYTVWLSGFALLVVTYYYAADLLLVDRTVFQLSASAAIGISVGTLVAAWLVYEGLCRSPIGRRENLLALIGFVFLSALFVGFTKIFSGRGTFIQMGAIIGTMMVANVFVVIIPNQKKMVAALIAGREPEARLGREGKTRSIHNNYLTLPVVFLMIGNHYPLMLRDAVQLAHLPARAGHRVSRPAFLQFAPRAAAQSVVGLGGGGDRDGGHRLALLDRRAQHLDRRPRRAGRSFVDVENIVVSRCSMCHAAEPVWDGIATAPRHVLLDTPENIRLHARDIEVLLRCSPPPCRPTTSRRSATTSAAFLVRGTRSADPRRRMGGSGDARDISHHARGAQHP